ncbi:LytR C-terminal domain-containing protein [Nocardioides sp. WL0053]|uniref:LytR C-terminal domain-containing protein n=1 Tax=Nocardioides jiangsuensis TaxID=2866161 RepID=A0ABS7RH55_9ACTN|nr:LytR C-terminal domain-containing protein [Nocardioides jiangsuensis]MBY9074361.1 LytR C-terminal domain-containing protein [Nocardioides jiangsuensis]
MGRQLTTAVTMFVLVGILVVGAILGWRSLFAELPGTATAGGETSASCTTEPIKAGQRVRAAQVEVSVFNAGTTSGLADETLGLLRKRGFQPGEASNAPSDADVRRVQVWSTIEDDAEARLVALQFGKTVKVTYSDVDLGPGVDVLVGDDFTGLSKAKTTLRVKATQQRCVSQSPNA